MPSLKDLRVRIKSVKSTQQITKTMKMVAAAKMRRAEDACQQSRPYTTALARVLCDLSSRVPQQGAPLMLRGYNAPSTIRLIVFGSSRGLCGGFNGQIARKAVAAIRGWEKQGKRVEIVTVGSKAYNEMKNHFASFIVDRNDAAAATPSYDVAQALAEKTSADFMAGTCHEVHILFNTFVNVLTQKPTLAQLLPFNVAQPKGSEKATAKASTEYEPNEETLLQHLLPLNVATQIFSALLESQASEQGARMSAMDSATRNAGKMIKSLSLTYNRQRQANITREITEIVSGAEAV